MKKLFYIVFTFCNIMLFGQISKSPKPIFIMDNIVIDRFQLAALDPNNIESVKVIKPQNNDQSYPDDLAKNGIIEFKMKNKETIEFLNFQQAKELRNLPIEAEVHLNNIRINELAILISKDMIMRGRILLPDNINKLKNPVLSLETGNL